MAVDVRDDGRTASAPSAKPEVWEGRPPEVRADQAKKLRLPPSPNFSYITHPFRWDVVEVDSIIVVVPLLREFRYEPGVCNVKDVRGKSSGDPSVALLTLSRRGWVEIPADIEVPTAAGRVKGYVRMYDGHQGQVHLPVWSRPVGLAGQVVIKHDLVHYNRFRLELVKNGVIEPPDETVLEAMAVRMDRAVNRRIDTRRGQAESEARMYRHKLKGLEGAMRPSEVSDGK